MPQILRRPLRLTLCALAMACAALPLQAQDSARSMIVLDGSGSMWGQIEGRAKLEIARDALAKVVGGLDAQTQIGLMAYGHRTKGQCDDIEVIVPAAKGTGAQIIAAAREMKFLGKTPLSAAVRQAAEALRYTEDKATVILITDGLETCEADPCALGAMLEAQGIDFTAHVVGFGLSAAEGQAVACLAETTGGRYLEAANAASLETALSETVIAAAPPPAPPVPAPAPPQVVVPKNVEPSATLQEGMAPSTFRNNVVFEFYPLAEGRDQPQLGLKPVKKIYAKGAEFLPPGRYLLRTTLHSVSHDQIITLTDTELATPLAVLNAGEVIVHAMASEGAPPDKKATIDLIGPKGKISRDYGTLRQFVPAGPYEIAVELGNGRAQSTIEAVLGETVERNVILGSGKARVAVSYDGTQAVEEADLKLEILSGETALDGTRARITTNYGQRSAFDLAPGRYHLRATLDAAVAEAPFEVRSGALSEIAVSLNAGVAAISAPDQARIEIRSAKADISGKRKVLHGGTGPMSQAALPAGEYIAAASINGTWVERPFTLGVGERSEVSLP